MKTATYAMMTGWALLMTGTTCWAATNLPQGQELRPTEQQVATTSVQENEQQLRHWVNSIKPAAGHTEDQASQGAEYWRQTVHRENRGKMQE